jgi:hypothetical protein
VEARREPGLLQLAVWQPWSMEAFESLVAGALRREGIWIYPGYHVDVSQADKQAFGQPSHPRPEIDILGYRPTANTLLWIECKSYLDSPGVKFGGFDGSSPKEAKRVPKVFRDSHYRQVVTRALIRETVAETLACPDPKVEYWFATGNIAEQSRAAIRQHFDEQGWTLLDREWIIAQLRRVGSAKYENDVATMVSKLLRP